MSPLLATVQLSGCLLAGSFTLLMTNSIRRVGCLLGVFIGLTLTARIEAAVTLQAALVRHAPIINGTVEGSVQQMTAEAVTLNSSSVITGDLLAPGN